MSHTPTLIDQLNDLRQQPTIPNQPVRSIQGHAAGVDYEVEVHEIDSIGCRLGRARITKADSTDPPSRPGKKSMSVAERAEHLCSRMGYLAENLALIEAEEATQTAIARSTTTTPQANGHGYFEAVVTPREIELHRYQVKPGEQRERADFSVTHETLQRIIDDASQTLRLGLDSPQQRNRVRRKSL